MSQLRQIGIDVDVHRAIEGARRSFAESDNEILRRLLLSQAATTRPVTPNARPAATATARSRGMWTVDIRGDRTSAMSLKDAYRTLLLKLHEHDPRFLDAFAQEKGRSRRYVARSGEDLYLRSPHLAQDFAEPLVDGWYVDTNLSTEQVAKRVRAAARVAGLRYGSEVRLLDNLREI